MASCYGAQCSHVAHNEGERVVLPLHSWTGPSMSDGEHAIAPMDVRLRICLLRLYG